MRRAPEDALADTAVQLPESRDGRPRPDRAGAAPATLAGRYRIGATLGRGGMGEVVGAFDEQIGREVAVKRMRADTRVDAGEARFLREARIQGQLEHPAIVPVHELATDADGQPYFVMKKLAGRTLATLLDGGSAASRQRLLRAFVDVCLAIEFAHTRGVIHRDLKPANIMLGDFGEVYVLDWGVARVRDDAPGERPRVDSASGPAGEVTATMTGTLLGTPGYMAPEQVRGDRDLDGRADVYALGCILFELLAGAPLHPPGALALQTTLVGLDLAPSARAPERGIPPELDAIVARAAALEPGERYATARALADDVTAFLDGDRDLALRAELAAAHLARARAALAGAAGSPPGADDGRAADEAARRVALREASSAIALDPRAEEATRLVTRLMLTPPEETPAEVQRTLAELDADHARSQARLGTGATLGYLLFVPLLLLIGLRDARYLAAYVGLVLGCAAATWALARSRAVGRPIIAAVVVSQVLLVALYARLFSPFLVAPGVAGTTLMAFAQHPRFGRLSVLWGAMTAGVLGPFALEALGAITPTMRFAGDALTLRSPALLVHAVPSQLALCAYVPVMLFVAVFYARQLARAQRDARRLVEIQRWQLRQLMPVG